MNSPRIAALVILSFLGPSSVWAQQGDCNERTIAANIIRDEELPVPAFDASNFAGRYKGKAVRINSVTVDQRPRRIILLIDASSSVLDERTWQLAMDVADDVLTRIPPPSEIGLVSFSEKVELKIEPTSDRKKLKEEIGRLRSTRETFRNQGSRRTALLDGLLESEKLLGPSNVGNVIFAITDGADNASHVKPNEVARILVAKNVRLFTMAIPPIPPLSPEEIDGPSDLLQIVRATGGEEIIPPAPLIKFGLREVALVDQFGKPTIFRIALDWQYQQILSFYRISISLPGPVDKPREWDLALTGFDKSAMKHLALHYPHTVVPCH